MTPDYINQMATRIYEQNKAVGWWDDPDRCLYECLQLISTEVAEATEGERKDLMDKHLPHRKSGEVELADALIRALDLGGHLGLIYKRHEPRVSWFQCHHIGKSHSIGRLHLSINACIIEFAKQMHGGGSLAPEYWDLIDGIMVVGERLGYDIQSAIEEKLLVNATRPDHKRENRQKAGGKKF